MQITYYPERERRKGARIMPGLRLDPHKKLDLTDKQFAAISQIPTYIRLVEQEVIVETVPAKPKRTRSKSKAKVEVASSELHLESEPSTTNNVQTTEAVM